MEAAGSIIINGVIDGKDGKDGKDGANGQNAVSYKIDCIDIIKPGDDYIYVEIIKSDGASISKKNLLNAKNDWGVTLSCTGLAGAKVEDDDDSQVNVSNCTITGNSKLILYLTLNGTIVDEKYLRGVTNGDTGPMCYIAGAYRDDIVYTMSQDGKQTVAVEVDTGGNTAEIYVLVAQTNLDSNGNHIAPTDSNQSVWEKGQNNYNLVRTKYLFTDFGLLASFVMTGDWQYSQYGDLISADGEVITIGAARAGQAYRAVLPVVLNGNEINSAEIVCRVSFTLAATTSVTIRLTPSSESDYDFGAVGELDSTALGNATSSTIKDGTDCLLYSSGTTVRSTTKSISAGTHFFYVAYAKDSLANANNDNVTIEFLNGSTPIDYTVSKVRATEGATYSGGTKTYVPYGWFDASDPIAKTLPAYGYKFRPSYAVDGLTGVQFNARGNFQITESGNIKIMGALTYHKVQTIDLAGGTGTDLFSAKITEDLDINDVTFKADTFILIRQNSSGAFALYLPPPRFAPGFRLKVIYGNHANDTVVTIEVPNGFDEIDPIKEENVDLKPINRFFDPLYDEFNQYALSLSLDISHYAVIELTSADCGYAPSSATKYYQWVVTEKSNMPGAG